MIRLCDTLRFVLLVGLLFTASILSACAQATAVPPGTSIPTLAPVVQTVEVEVTRVVYRETLVTPTPAPLAPCSPANLADASEIVIGALLPLSAPGAWMRSANMQAGLNLALEQMNTVGASAVPIRLALYDTGDDPARSAQLAEQLITQDCAAGIIVGLGDAATEAVVGVTERFRKPALIIDAASPQLTETQPESVFRLAPALPMTANMPADWLASIGDYNKDGVVQAVVIAENSPAGDMFVAQSGDSFVQQNIDVQIHRVDLPTTDFSPEIARLLAMPTIPDAVFVVFGADSALDLQEQLFDAGIRPDKGTLVVNQSRRALDSATSNQRRSLDIGSILARRGPWTSGASEAGRYIFDRYRQGGMGWPDLATFLARDAVWLLTDAMQRAPSLAGSDLIRALEDSDVELAAGRYTFPYGSSQPPDGERVPFYAWHQWMTPPLLYLMVTQEAQDLATLDIIWPEAYRTPQPEAPADGQ